MNPQWRVSRSRSRAATSFPFLQLQQDSGGTWGYELRRTFHAVNMLAPHVYDQQDAFFLPLSGFSGIGRPGPNISIYRRR
jgi:hypothetical protein